MLKPLHTYNFRSLLTVVILSLLVFSMGLVGVVSVLFAKASVEQLAGVVIHQSSQQVFIRLQQFFRQATDESALCVRRLEGQSIAAADFPRLAWDILPSFDLHQDLSRVYLGLSNTGEYFMLERQGPDCQLREGVEVAPGQRQERLYRAGKHGWELTTNRLADNYDPRQRPFFQQAHTTGTNGWTEAYEFFHKRGSNAVTGLTYTAPVHGLEGQFVAALGVDLETGVLNSFLKDLDDNVPGYSFLIQAQRDGRRRVVAHPHPASAHPWPSGTNRLDLDVGTFDDPALQALLANLGESFEQLARRTPQTQRIYEFTVDGEPYWGSCAVPPGDARWLVGMVVPRFEVMHDVRRYALWYLATFGGVLLLAALAILPIARRASQPLLQLFREAEAVGRLEFAAGPIGDTRILEIRALSGAMSRMKTNLRSFQKYVPAEVVGDLVRSGQEAALGGEKLVATVYFSDIADFTATAERMEPEALVAHLGQYLGVMSEGIRQHGGTVDKFIGDAVMAFWNAPRPEAAHALHACEAALANQRRLDELAGHWQTRQLPPLHTRIGLHTGPVIVGNIGSEWRMNYTIIGDSVNLASRLESLNKFYGTRILVSQATLDQAGPALLARPLDCVNVKGKSHGVIIHELLARHAQASPAQIESAQFTAEAFALYRENRFADAQEIYARLVTTWPADHAAEILRRRCHAFAAQPPSADWDGIYRLEVK
jgi:adenylate cyclase